MCSQKVVTFIINSLSGGGSEAVCVNIANELAKQGWRVEVVCINMKRDEYSNTLDPKVHLVDLGAPRFMFSPPYLISYLLKKKPKTVVCFHYYISALLLLVKKVFRFKFRLIGRNNTSLKQAEMEKKGIEKIAFKLTVFLYRKIDHVISQCEDMKDGLVNDYDFDPRKITVIYNFARGSLNKEIECPDSGDIENKYILCVGRLAPLKQFDHAIRAFSRVKPELSDLKLKIAGQGHSVSELKDLCVELNIEDDVEFLGFSNSLSFLYKNAQLTLLTSRFEGFPNVLVESISVGTPVVSYNCPTGPSEIIEESINGKLVLANDEEHLLASLRAALTHDWDPEKVITTSRRFTSKEIVKRYEDVISLN